MLLFIDPSVVGKRLTSARRIRGLTRKQVGEALDVSETTIAELEDGTRRPEARELYALSRLYGRPLGDLIRPVHEYDPAVVAECLATHAMNPAVTKREHERNVQRCEDVSYWYVELTRMLGYSEDVELGATLRDRYESLAARAYAESLISEGQLARILATDRVSAVWVARERLRHLSNSVE